MCCSWQVLRGVRTDISQIDPKFTSSNKEIVVSTLGSNSTKFFCLHNRPKC